MILQYFTVMNALKTSNNQTLQNYMIPEKFYSLYIKRNICSTPHYVMLQEGHSQLQYRNYFMHLIRLFIWGGTQK